MATRLPPGVPGAGSAPLAQFRVPERWILRRGSGDGIRQSHAVGILEWRLGNRRPDWAWMAYLRPWLDEPVPRLSLDARIADVIPYRGMADLSRAVLSGEIDIAMVDEISVGKLVASGRARAIATMSARPAVLFPELPLWRDFGFGALDIELILVLFAGRRMGGATRSRLADMLQTLSRSPDFHEGVSKLGFVPTVHTGADAMRIVADHVARERRLLRESGSGPVSASSPPSAGSPAGSPPG